MTEKINIRSNFKSKLFLASFFWEKWRINPVENKIKACVIPCAYVRGTNNDDIKKIQDDNIMPNEEPIPKVVNILKYEPSKRLKISNPKKTDDKTRKIESKYIC